MNSGYYFKPCFYPWTRSDIAFDSILALAITCKHDAVYLSKYVKDYNHIELLFTTYTKDKIAHLNTQLLSGINTYKLTSDEGEIVGTASLIDTPLHETYIEPDNAPPADRLRLSPICFTRVDTDITTSYIDINKEKKELAAQEIFLDDNLSGYVSQGILEIRPLCDVLTVQAAKSGFTYVTSVGTKTTYVGSDGATYTEYIVQLPDSIKVESVSHTISSDGKNVNSVVTLSVESKVAQCYTNKTVDLYTPHISGDIQYTRYALSPCFTEDDKGGYKFDLTNIEEKMSEFYELDGSDTWDKLRDNYDIEEKQP